MDDNRMTIPESDIDITRGRVTGLSLSSQTLRLQQPAPEPEPAGLCALLSLLIVQGLSRIHYRDNFLQLRPNIVFTLWGKVLEFINPQLFEKSVNIGRGLMVSGACVLFRQVHKNPKIASAPAPANPRHTRLWLRENQTINNKPCERENTGSVSTACQRKSLYPVGFLVPINLENNLKPTSTIRTSSGLKNHLEYRENKTVRLTLIWAWNKDWGL